MPGVGMPDKPVLRSTTTQSVAASAAASGGGLIALIAFIRSNWPDAIPWAAESDIYVVGVATTIIAPLLSRWLKPLLSRVKGQA